MDSVPNSTELPVPSPASIDPPVSAVATSRHLFDPLRQSSAPPTADFEGVEKTFIRRVRTGAPTLPVLADFPDLQPNSTSSSSSSYSSSSSSSSSSASSSASDTNATSPTEDALVALPLSSKTITTGSGEDGELQALFGLLANKHLGPLNTELMDLVEREHKRLQTLLRLQRMYEERGGGKSEIDATNSLLLESIRCQRELIANLLEVRGDSLHADRQAHRLRCRLAMTIDK